MAPMPVKKDCASEYDYEKRDDDNNNGTHDTYDPRRYED